MNKKSVNKRFFIFLFCLAVVVFSIGVIYAINNTGEGYRVISGEPKIIDAWGVCKKVVKNTVVDIFVPTRTDTEWANFRNNLPAGVTLDECYVATTEPLGDCPVDVYYSNLSSTYQWKTSKTFCISPQCENLGGINGNTLIADNYQNFTDYPARDACKALGGRLPTKRELICLHSRRGEYSGFVDGRYWSGSEQNETDAFNQWFNEAGAISGMDLSINNKDKLYKVRCVR